MPGFQYQLQSSPDLKTWTTVATVTPDASGVCSKNVIISGTTYFRYAFDPPAANVTSFAARSSAVPATVAATPRRLSAPVKKRR